VSDYPTREFAAIRDRDAYQDWRYLAGVILAVLLVEAYTVGLVILVWEVK
jgi:hypothetical protein